MLDSAIHLIVGSLCVCLWV